MLRAVASQVLAGTWASKPASAPAGTMYFASDVGEAGTLFMYGASRWRPVNGAAALKTLGAATGNIANSETIVLQTLVPAGAWQVNDSLRLTMVQTKSGGTDSFHVTVRVGTAGSTADTAISGLSAHPIMSTGTAGGAVFDIKLEAAASARRLGPNATATSTYSNPNAAATQPSATAITDSSANALYVSLGIKSSGTTDTVTLQSAQIQLITP